MMCQKFKSERLTDVKNSLKDAYPLLLLVFSILFLANLRAFTVICCTFAVIVGRDVVSVNSFVMSVDWFDVSAPRDR